MNTPFPIHHIQVKNAGKLAYIDEGKGEKTLLFIHGLATYGLSWKKNMAELKSQYRCVAIDLPGNGFSERGNYPYSIRFFADCLFDFIQILKLKNVCLVGHSMGGQIAITTLLHHPSAAIRMVLCAPAGLEVFSEMEKSFHKPFMQAFDFFSTEESSLKRVIRSSFYNDTSQGDGMTDDLVEILKHYPAKQYRAMIEACIHAMLYEPVYDKLAEINVPMLMIFGERDALIPNRLIHHITTKQLAEQSVKKMKQAELKLIPACGHFVHWEKAKEVNDLIKDFLSAG